MTDNEQLMLLFKDAADSEDYREFKDAVLNWMEAVTRRLDALQKTLARFDLKGERS